MTSDSNGGLSKSNRELGGESPMTEIQPEEFPSDTHLFDTSRVRSGTGGVSVKVLLSLILLGLLPVLGTMFFLREHDNSIKVSGEQVEKDVNQLVSYVGKLNDQLLESYKKTTELEHALAIQRFLSDRKKEFSSLAGKLRSAMAELTEEQIPNDKVVANTIKNAPFDQVLLIKKSDDSVLISKTGKHQGKIDKVFPGLMAAMKKSKKESKQDDDTREWLFVELGVFSYMIAAKTRPPVYLGDEGKTGKIPPLPSVSLSDFKKASQRFHSTIEILWWALPLFAFVLAVIVFSWIFSALLRPFAVLTSSAAMVLEQPGRLDHTLSAQSGLAKDLGTSLFRLDQRSVRLAELEKKSEDMAKELAVISETIKLASAGMQQARVSTSIPEFQELSQSINDLLESMTGKLESVHRATALINEAAVRIDPVISKLSESMGGNVPVLLPDVSHMGKLLGIYIRDLCSVADNIQKLVTNDAPEQLDQEELNEYKVSIQGTQNGIQLLKDNIDGIVSMTRNVMSVRKDVEILSTNLSIVLDNRSSDKVRPHLERVVVDAEKLSANLSELCQALTRSTENLAVSSKKVTEVFLKTTAHFKKTAKQLIGWSSLHAKLSRMSKELGDKVEVVRPNAAVLGEDIQKLFSACTQNLSNRKELADLISLATEANRTIVKTTHELLSQMEQLNVNGARPEITAALAQQQVELRRMLTELNALADSEGVDTLSEETRQILDQVHSMAKSARERILKIVPTIDKIENFREGEMPKDNEKPSGEQQDMDVE